MIMRVLCWRLIMYWWWMMLLSPIVVTLTERGRLNPKSLTQQTLPAAGRPSGAWMTPDKNLIRRFPKFLVVVHEDHADVIVVAAAAHFTFCVTDMYDFNFIRIMIY